MGIKCVGYTASKHLVKKIKWVVSQDISLSRGISRTCIANGWSIMPTLLLSLANPFSLMFLVELGEM